MLMCLNCYSLQIFSLCTLFNICIPIKFVTCLIFLCRSKYNLNAMSHDTAIGLIQKVLDHGVNLKEVRNKVVTGKYAVDY